MANCCFSFYLELRLDQSSRRTAPFSKKKIAVDFSNQELNLENKKT